MSEKNHVRFAESVRKEQMKFAPDQVNMAAANDRTPIELGKLETRQPNAMDEQFPTEDLTSYDAKDREMNARLALQGDQQGYTPFGRLEARDSDFEWLAKKEAAVERANMEAWFARNFDFMSPAQKQYAKKIFPGFYDARRRLLKKQSENLFDVARIKLDGLEDFADVKKQYLLETGRLDLGPLQHLMNPEGVNGTAEERRYNAMRFKRGLANPWLVFGKEAIPAEVSTRQEQTDMFADRKYTENQKLGVRAGVEDTGFPPFSGKATDQSDGAWYKNLTTGMKTLN